MPEPKSFDEDTQSWTHGAAVANVSLANAGATYTSAEQNLINDLKAKVNAILPALRSAGIIEQD